ncbi:hypothetical protein M569_15161 [Genlisea aurea]|uniref:DRBM domain-containing protein n=1 Tax=Genlisea aurea TaxID=192259 RepID=S8BYZ6_9LAMI|nr:hypothetical protein M569_15161 [Genlisea aurea]
MQHDRNKIVSQDETGVYKNLLQEIAQRVGSPLPHYMTFKSGLGHLPVFTGTVELAGITFRGEPAKNKKQAEKNAALAAWLSLKKLAQQDSAGSASSDHESNDEQEQITIARALQSYRLKGKKLEAIPPSAASSSSKFTGPAPRPSSPQRPPASKMLPLFFQQPPPSPSERQAAVSPHPPPPQLSCRWPSPESLPAFASSRFAVGAAPYVPINNCRKAATAPYHGMAPPVTIRTSVPVFSAPSSMNSPHRPIRVAPAVSVRTVIPAFRAPPTPLLPRDDRRSKDEEAEESDGDETDANTVARCLEQLEI